MLEKNIYNMFNNFNEKALSEGKNTMCFFCNGVFVLCDDLVQFVSLNEKAKLYFGGERYLIDNTKLKDWFKRVVEKEGKTIYPLDTGFSFSSFSLNNKARNCIAFTNNESKLTDFIDANFESHILLNNLDLNKFEDGKMDSKTPPLILNELYVCGEPLNLIHKIFDSKLMLNCGAKFINKSIQNEKIRQEEAKIQPTLN